MHTAPLQEKFAALVTDLRTQLLDALIIDDPLRLLAYGTDASFYRLIPKVVVEASNADQVKTVLALCHQYELPVTFRAAGTSLSGQAISDSVLLRLKGWTDHEVLDNGGRIKLQPGVIGAQANRYLAPFQRKIGPDPASIGTAKIGGIAANNASGMCCGTANNSYHTLTDIRVILHDGSELNTADPVSRAEFSLTHAPLLASLQQLAVETRQNLELADKIRHKYRLKNTTGYSLNALVDYSDPIDILQHLMIGSEGTLGFISEITYRTCVEHPCKATALVLFPDVKTTCEAVTALKQCPVSAVELIDRTGLHAIEAEPGVPPQLKALSDDAAALLIDVRGESHDQLVAALTQVEATLHLFPRLNSLAFTQNADEIAQLWKIRKGLFPAVGALRQTGTTVIIEDVAFPIEHLAEGVLQLQQLFKRYKYTDALIFGHALEGNLHFVFTQDFSTDAEVTRYRQFMDAVAELVAVKYGGSLKAEHGTGRNMAPYVELEWGKDAYALMKKIKALFDPANLLNPGVIINDNKQAHIENLKPLPPVDPLVDKCIECGFCEPQCPSRNLTLTPRQRIVISREIARLQTATDAPSVARLKALQKEYRYYGDDTCAACGLCEMACPVNINTGDLTRKHRNVQNAKHFSRAEKAAHIFSRIVKLTRLGLTLADQTHRWIGPNIMQRSARALNKISRGAVPEWHPYLPASASQPPKTAQELPQGNLQPVVYLPSCASRTMAPARGDRETRSLSEVFTSLLDKAGYYPIYPNNLDHLCCGLPFQSKGMFDQARSKSQELERALSIASKNGQIPIVSDTSPCSLRSQQAFKHLRLYDSVEFVHDVLMPALQFTRCNDAIMVHATCSTTRLGQSDKLLGLAERCTPNIVVPEDVTCCGFAGDKGFTLPALNDAALGSLKSAVPPGCKEGVSTSRSCEIGLSKNSGIHYHSILYLVDRCTIGLAR